MNMDHGNMPGMNMAAPKSTTGTATPMSGMDMGMDMTALAKLKGKAFDRAWLSMMVAHHQGAIDMSKAVVNSVKDKQVKTWANAIINVQQKEIASMNGWLKSLGGVDKAAQSSMAKGMNVMVAALKQDKDSDRALVVGMLPHHASAIDMGNLALQYSDNANVLKLAREIIRTQASEMYDYKQWLLKR